MQKIILKFAAVVTTAIASHTPVPVIGYPKFLRPEIRVEKVKSAGANLKVQSNENTALS